MTAFYQETIVTPIDMRHEPLRLPAWATAILVTFLPVVIAVLLEQEWRVALAAALSGLLVGTPIVAAAEAKRAFTESPATIELAIEESWSEFEGTNSELADLDDGG